MLRDYQEQALSRIAASFDRGTRSICLVSPTGSGKSTMGSAAAHRETGRVVWLAHRSELIDQAVATLGRFGIRTGVFAAQRMEQLDERVIVASWQTMLSRGETLPADLLITDECHHAKSTEWQTVIDRYTHARRLGLTATPQRGDGRALGDVFDELIVAAQYSELIKAGHLVPCRVFRPEQDMSPAIARHPLVAYQAHAHGKQAIVFARSVQIAREYAREFNDAGIAADSLDGTTTNRQEIIERFKSGATRVLVNVFVLTEGFDHPACEVCIIARGCSYTGTYLQMVGRVLRPAPGKQAAILIDLAGVSHSHGLPTEDRTYSLDGKQAISSTGALTVCPSCGLTYAPSGNRACPGCGYSTPTADTEPPRPRIYDMELLEVFAGADTPEEFQLREWQRLVELCTKKNWGLDWGAKQFHKLFHHYPRLTEQQQRDMLRNFREFASRKGFKPGFAAVRFKEICGFYPPRGW